MIKIIKIVVLLGFVAGICFAVFMSYQFYHDFKKPKTPQKLAAETYYKRHHKEINEKFVVDTMQYCITGFNYYPKKDTTFLYVDVLIENKLNRTKKYIDSFFVLKEGFYKTYYPTMLPYPVFENKIQTLKLQYILPEKQLPYLRYDLHLISKADTATNAMVILYKSYRANG